MEKWLMNNKYTCTIDYHIMHSFLYIERELSHIGPSVKQGNHLAPSSQGHRSLSCGRPKARVPAPIQYISATLEGLSRGSMTMSLLPLYVGMVLLTLGTERRNKYLLRVLNF